MKPNRRKKMMAVLLSGAMVLGLTGCVDQHPEKHQTAVAGTDAVEIAKEKVEALGREPKVIATSPSVTDICDRLEMDLIGVPESKIREIPARYKDVRVVGMAMSPDMEIVAGEHPDWILSPNSLISDLKPKYEAIDADYAFLDLRSVEGMYTSMDQLGEIFGKEKEAAALRKEYETFMQAYRESHKGKKTPKVMILMGLPGSYIIATENSYVGSLVEMAGGENVYAGTDKEFLTVNTEDMKQKKPDIILRCAHALPDQVKTMFDKDFKENDIWHHFEAVKNDRVYDLSNDNFGMSARFNYPEALKELDAIFYGGEVK